MQNTAPRNYPDLVNLVRRSEKGSSFLEGKTSPEEICHWLVKDALGENDLLELFESLVWRLLAASLPVHRASLHVGTLHPQLLGFYWMWNNSDGIVDELAVDLEGVNAPRYSRSPLTRAFHSGESFHASTDDPDLAAKYPILEDLRQDGYHDYAVLPLGAGGAYHNAVTLATRKENGFTDSDMGSLAEILGLFALHVERHIASRITTNVLRTYLGDLAGRQVLDGSIQRGSGQSIRAIIWVSDLRNFSGLVDKLSGDQVLTVLNAYFERLAGAAMAHGGEVLKYVGDGLLVVFRIDENSSSQAAAAASLAAAQQALQDIDDLNYNTDANTDGPMKAISGWSPLRSGIALHYGEIFFGNLGAPERLDFTVIGRAVNEASRVEALTKELGREVLITDSVAQLLEAELDDLGVHTLRGIKDQVRLFAPRTP